MVRILAKPGFRVSSGPSVGSSCVCLYSRLVKDGFDVIEWSAYRMLFGDYDVLHLHWPDNILTSRSRFLAFLKTAALFAGLGGVKLRNKRVVWTAHNLDSHAQIHPLIEKWYWKVFPKFLDGVIAPMEWIEKKLREDERFAKVPCVRCYPFGDWSDFYKKELGGRSRFQSLNISPESKVVLWFGLVKPYKGVEDLLRVFADPRLSNTVLVVAGRCRDAQYLSVLEVMAAGMPNVRTLFRFFDDREVGDLFDLADLCIFPFREITNTGSVRLALTFNKHALVPDFPFAREFKDKLGPEWISTYPPGSLTAEMIVESLAASEKMDGQIVSWGSYSWDESAAETGRFFRKLVGEETQDRCDNLGKI